jgi:sporulation-control protein spo0M
MDGPGGVLLAERAAVRHRETQYAKSSNLECEIELEGTVYYDGDILRGEVCINAKEDGIYRNVLVLLLCRFIGRDPALSPRERCTTLHLSKYPLAAEMHIPQGLTKVPFEFAIPENVPPTFSSKWGDVCFVVMPLQFPEGLFER